MLYHQARDKAGSVYPGGSGQFAADRIDGDATFQSVIESDMAFYIDRSNKFDKLMEKDVPHHNP